MGDLLKMLLDRLAAGECLVRAIFAAAFIGASPCEVVYPEFCPKTSFVGHIKERACAAIVIQVVGKRKLTSAQS